MPRNRYRAAAVLLVWMALGILASTRMVHASGRTESAVAHLGGGAASHCGGSPPQGPPPARGTPCQWILPLLCCEQQAAADATAPALVSFGTFWVRLEASAFAPIAAMRWSPPAAETAQNPPALAHSVVLQV